MNKNECNSQGEVNKINKMRRGIVGRRGGGENK
jgi:hypothetical protein